MEKLGSWIPQAFYDLIGRITPGSALILVTLLVFLGPETTAALLSSAGLSAGTVVLIALVLSYMTGALLGGIGLIRLNKRFWCASRLGILDETVNEQAYVYDFVHFHRPEIGARLSKLSAERHMCRVMIVGTLLLSIIHLVSPPVWYPSHCWLWAIEVGLIVAAGGAYCLYRHLEVHAGDQMRNTWRMIIEGLPQGTAAGYRLPELPESLRPREGAGKNEGDTGRDADG